MDKDKIYKKLTKALFKELALEEKNAISIMISHYLIYKHSNQLIKQSSEDGEFINKLALKIADHLAMCTEQTVISLAQEGIREALKDFPEQAEEINFSSLRIIYTAYLFCKLHEAEICYKLNNKEEKIYKQALGPLEEVTSEAAENYIDKIKTYIKETLYSKQFLPRKIEETNKRIYLPLQKDSEELFFRYLLDILYFDQEIPAPTFEQYQKITQTSKKCLPEGLQAAITFYCHHNEIKQLDNNNWQDCIQFCYLLSQINGKNYQFSTNHLNKIQKTLDKQIKTQEKASFDDKTIYDNWKLLSYIAAGLTYLPSFVIAMASIGLLINGSYFLSILCAIGAATTLAQGLVIITVTHTIIDSLMTDSNKVSDELEKMQKNITKAIKKETKHHPSPKVSQLWTETIPTIEGLTINNPLLRVK